ncbi:MAG: phosphate transporter substrate-binding protein PhoT family [Cytophagaceae bacterium]|nr:phosphate transporter substrate-binding protein PhoT family [Cytophagaceae bacterium]
MKKTKTRTIDFLLILGASLLLLSACHQEAPIGKEQVVIPTDTIFVASDSSQKVILTSLIEVYEALNPLRKVIPIFAREKQLYEYIRTDKVDLIFRSYLLTESEKKDIEKRKLNPKIHPFWTDGLAVIASNGFPKEELTEEELTAVLTNRSTAFHTIVDNSNTSTYDLIFDKYALDKKQVNAYAAGSEDSVISAVRQHDNYIGLIGSSYFTVDKEALPKGIKLLGLIPAGKQKAEYPFQDQLYNGVYPLTRQIHGINVGAMDGSGSAFASFVLSERGQRIILKAGLLPAKIPPRTIELVTE